MVLKENKLAVEWFVVVFGTCTLQARGNNIICYDGGMRFDILSYKLIFKTFSKLADIMAKEDVYMTNNPLQQNFFIGDVAITRQEIAFILTFDGFGFVASEFGWSEQLAAQQFRRLGNVVEKLTNDDCEQFVTGFVLAIDKGETRYQHVLTFTSKLFEKWGLLSAEELKQSA